MNEVKLFENEELGIFVRTILNEDGSISVNAEDTAIGYGWTKTEVKNGKQYTSIRWETLNGYCAELGFANKLAKDDYIPESLFYRLGMKASNAKAERFQNWLAIKVIPSIRKNGGYIAGQETLSDEELMAKALIVAQNKIVERDGIIEVQQKEIEEQRKEIFEKEQKIAELEIDVDSLRRLHDMRTLTNLRDSAKILGMSQSQFTGFLVKNGFCYRTKNGFLRPTEPSRNKGLFEMRSYVNGFHSDLQTMLTQYGIQFFRSYFESHDIIPDALPKHGGRDAEKRKSTKNC